MFRGVIPSAIHNDIGKIERFAVVDSDGERVFRYMKAIPTDALCLACHSENVQWEVLDKNRELYPALGFNVGDIRGAPTLRKKLD